MKTFILAFGLAGFFAAVANAVILPPTDDSSGTLVITGTPPVVSKTTLTSAQGAAVSLPVARKRPPFLRLTVDSSSLPADFIEQARLTLYFPSVVKAGSLGLHLITQDWDETFPEKSRPHPAIAASFLTIPAASVVKKQFVILDVTEQVKAMLLSPGTLFGFAVSSPDGIANITLGSKEGTGTGYPPLLEIVPNVTAANAAVVAASKPPPGMVYIPGGTFTMGDSLDGNANALPVSATVSAFFMDVNEVTHSQWQSVYQWATGNGYSFTAGAGKGVNHPVHTVSWYDVLKWCNARSEQAGRTPVYYTDDAQTMVYKSGAVDLTNAQVKWAANGYRLPTEAEWERAARGGMSGQRFPWGNTITQTLANYLGNTALAGGYDLGPNGYHPLGNFPAASPGTTPVGTFASNGFGLNDMAGNVFEWCWDWHGTAYAGGMNPKGPVSGTGRVIRGGSWLYGAEYLRCANHAGDNNPSNADNNVGFRCVLAPVQP